MRLLSWNMAHRDVWGSLDIGADVALLQEVAPPSALWAPKVIPNSEGGWRTTGWEKCDWRTAIARLSDDVTLAPRPTVPMHETAGNTDFAVSRAGTISAVDVAVEDQVQFTAVSIYAKWERPLGRDEPCWADASAHRLLSDLTPLLWDQRRHPVLIAGDWNILYRYGEHGDPVYGQRYASVFDRAAALGLRLLGPFHPNGRQATPWPSELPEESPCVPTYFHSRQTPETATRQLDFVFASEGIADRVTVRAMNEVDEWGPSDHSRIVIDVE